MKIKKIRIEGIQSIKYPLEFNLSDGITQLKGHNAAGKSAVVKSLKIFSGCYTKKDIKSLITRDMSAGRKSTVTVTLEDDKILHADISPTGNVEYYYIDENNTLINKWNTYTRQVSEILDLKFIEQAELCLNFKPFNENIFIDTKPNENAEIMDYLCKEPEVEIKIANIEEYSEHLNELKYDIKKEISRVNSIMDKIQVLPYKQIQERDAVLNVIYQTLKFNELLGENIRLIESNIKNNQYSSLDKLLRELLVLKYTNNTINLLKQRLLLYKLRVQLEESIEISKLTDIIEYENKIKSYKYKLNENYILNKKLKSIITINKMNSNIDSRLVVDDVNSSYKQVLNLIQITKINKYSESIKKIKQTLDLKEQNISFSSHLKALNQQKRIKTITSELSSNLEIKNKINEIYDLNNLIAKQLILNRNKNLIDIINLSNKINYIIDKKDRLSLIDEAISAGEVVMLNKFNVIKCLDEAREIKICPVCKQPLDNLEEHLKEV